MNPAGTLALKLVLTPVLVGGASLASRRWGSAVGGWLIGIPFTSGPVALFLALDPGPRFAATAAAGIMAGTASQAAFCLAYAWTAQARGWALSLAAASAAFGLVTIVLRPVALPRPVFFVAMLAVLAVSLPTMPRVMPRPNATVQFHGGGGPPPWSPHRDTRRMEAFGGPRWVTAGVNPAYSRHPSQFPRWDIPARMIVATVFVIVLTTAAPLLGARLAGLLAPFPLYASVLATFAHRLEGTDGAVAVLRGLLLGLFAFAAFFFVLAELLETSIAVAFLGAICVALAMQAVSLFVGRRLGLA